jgi:hypothetical protein
MGQGEAAGLIEKDISGLRSLRRGVVGGGNLKPETRGYGMKMGNFFLSVLSTKRKIHIPFAFFASLR